MLEDTQKQARRAGRTIAGETFLLLMIMAMLTTVPYPCANEDWGDRAKDEKTSANWKIG